jgi:PKD repeat protein
MNGSSICAFATRAFEVQCTALTITVYPAAMACPGDVATFIGSGMSTYSWTGIGTGPSTSGFTTNTCVTVSGTNACGIYSNSACVTFTTGSTVSISGTPTVCAGSSTTLSASATGSTTGNFTWMPGALTSPTIVVTPTATTCYTVQVANVSGCVSNTSHCITVPAVSFTSSVPGSMCVGQTATISAGGLTTYSWSTGSVSNSIVVAPTSNVCYFVTGVSPQGCSVNSQYCLLVYGNPTLTVFGSTLVACTTLSLLATGATNYTWIPGNYTVNPLVIPNYSTSGCFTVYGSNGGCTSYTTACITVPAPNLSVSTVPGPSVCPGNSTSMFASGATSYTWYPGAIVNFSYVVTPASSTCYTLAGTVGSCTAATQKCIGVHPVPVITVTGNQNICAGETTTLSASGATTYTWVPGLSFSSNHVVAPANTTTYTVFGSNVNGCVGSNTIAVVVTPTPALAVSGNTVICAGSTSTLLVTGGISYTWQPMLLTGASVVVTPTATTCYTVSGTNSSGCTNSLQLCVMVNSVPAVQASGSGTICNGSVVSLSASGASTYTWSNGANSASILVTPTISTCYTVMGGNGTGCTGSAVACVSVEATPAVSVTYSIMPNGVVDFTANCSPTGPGYQYNWSFGNGTTYSVTGQNTATATYTSGGSYTVTLWYVSPLGCSTPHTFTVSVPNFCNVNSSFTYSQGAAGSVTFAATGLPGWNYAWQFGVSGTAATQVAVHTFTSNGIHTVTLAVSVPGTTPLCAASSTQTLVINNITCTVAAAFTHTVLSNGQVAYSDASAGSHAGSQFFWNFGDGSFSLAQNPTHFYLNGGAHLVKFRVTNTTPGSCIDSVQVSVNITGISCNANSNFSLSPTNTAQVWNALPAYPWNVSAAAWDWGDNSGSNTLYTSHQYSAAGMYNICLTVTVSCASTSSTCTSYSVYRSSQAANIVQVNVIDPALISGVADAGVVNRFHFDIMPVPNDGFFTLNAQGISHGFLGIEIYSMLGQRVFENNYRCDGNAAVAAIDIQNVPSGIYFVRASSGPFRDTRKIVVTR